MDYTKKLTEFGQSAGIIALLVMFIVILTIVMISLGPQAPSVAKMVCDTLNATTFCHV